MSPLAGEPRAAELEAQLRRFAAGVGREHGAVRYERICAGTAADPGVLSLIAAARPGQRRPNILLAAVHYLLLSGVEHPLASYYPTVAAWRGDAGPAPGRSATGDDLDGIVPAFADFCRRHRDLLVPLVTTRATQTNEVGRCTALLPALSAVGSRAGRPLALLDLGASAGLNLLFDRYAYDYRVADDSGPLPGPSARGGPAGRDLAGDPGSPVLLSCTLRGTPAVRPLPRSVPTVAARLGLDRAPVDVRDDDAVLWLLACQWPDDLVRFRQARAAVAVARGGGGPPRVLEGDMVVDLASAVARLPPDAYLCLVHSWAAAYLSSGEQRSLREVVAALGADRPVSWIYAEAPYEVADLPMPAPPAGHPHVERGATALVLVDAAPGRGPVATRLADMHSHGRWLAWYA